MVVSIATVAAAVAEDSKQQTAAEQERDATTPLPLPSLGVSPQRNSNQCNLRALPLRPRPTALTGYPRFAFSA